MTIGSTPRELLTRICVPDLIEMMAYDRIEPFGPLVPHFVGGQIAATIANVQRDSRNAPEPYSAEDFMPALRQPMKLLGEGMTHDQLSDLIDAKVLKKRPTVH